MTSVREIPLSIHSEENGSVVVFEEGTVPFAIRRTFVVSADLGQIRGDHAHKLCSQVLVVLRGQVLVSTNNGWHSQKFLLTELAQGLLVPPLVWATQEYLAKDSILLVACDQTYDEEDYIRSYAEFQKLVTSKE
jgi:dTDP-4-dehydrorhamnose 3,5-epimerase-like enzyme